ncbi:MAG: glycoside hydrolase family 38 C-terminal domain-containing protein [Clostridiaceae bacterium]
MLKYKLRYPVLGAHLNSIRARVYRVVCRLDAEIMPSAEPIPFGELSQHSFTYATRGASWGRKLSCAWLRISGRVPEGLKNPVLLVHNTGEGLLYTPEGEILDGLSDVWAPNDIPRASGKCVSLRLPGLTAGKAFTYYMDYGYNGIVLNDIGHARFFGAFLAETDELVYAYYYDYVTLFILLAETDDAEKKKELSRALERSYRAFVKDGAAAAREVLAVPLSKRSRDPLTFSAVGHGHLDLAWMWPIRETMRKSARTYAMALSNIARYPDYLYGTSQPQQLQWMKERNPVLYARIRQAVIDGRIELQGGFWTECDCNLSGGESLVRQAIYGTRFAEREFGKQMRICWLPDAFGFNGNLPQILRGCGMEYFSTIKLAWNKVNVFPYRSFVWRGVDGSEVLVHMPPEGDYNSGAAANGIFKAVRRYPECSLETALLVYGGGDGGGGPRESHLELLSRERDLEGLPKIKLSSAIAFFDSLKQKAIPHYYKGELYLETHQGTLTTQAENKRYNRLMERLLHNLETLCALFSPQDYPYEALEEIWKEVLLYQFHDILPGSSIKRVYTESCAGYAKMEQRLNALIEQVIPKADAVAAVNLTSFARSEYVRWQNGWRRAEIAPYAAAETTPFAEAPEALSYTDTTMSNGLMTLTFNEYGEIASCRTVGGRELAKGTLNRLTLYRDKLTIPFDAWDIDVKYYKKHSRRLRAAEVEIIIDGPRVVRKQIYRFGKSYITQSVILELDSERVLFETECSWHERLKMLRADFYPADYGDSAEFDIQFGAMERTTTERDSVEAAQFEVCGQKWASVHREGRGFALVNDSKYGWRVKNGLMSLNLLRAPVYPDKTADRGTHRFRYAFCPLGADNSRAVEQAYRLNNPLLVGGYKPFESAASVSNPGVVLETIKRSEDGNAVVLRLYESLGHETEMKLFTRLRFEHAVFCDLLERPTESADVEHLRFRPYQIVTIRLEGGALDS